MEKRLDVIEKQILDLSGKETPEESLIQENE